MPGSDSTQIARRGARRSSCRWPGRCRCPRTPSRLWSRWKMPKIRSKYSGSMPMPLSWTAKRQPCPQSRGRRRGPRRSAPRNLIALPTRFWNSWISCISSRHDGRELVVGHDRRRSPRWRRLRFVQRLAAERPRSTSVGRARCPGVPTREKVSRSWIRRCMRLRAVDREADELVGVGVELALVAPAQQLRVARHHAQRLLQVVRGDVGELLELLVGARELVDGREQRASPALRTLMSRMAAVTRIPVRRCRAGESISSIGNSVPSLRRAVSSIPVPICWASAASADAQVVGDQPLGEALGDDVRDLLAEQLIAVVAELLLGLDIEQDDLARLVDHDHRVRRGLEQAAVAALDWARSASAALRTLMSRMAAVTRMPSATAERGQHELDRELGCRPCARPMSSMPVPICWARAASGLRRSSAISRSANPSGMMFVTGWPRSSSRR